MSSDSTERQATQQIPEPNLIAFALMCKIYLPRPNIIELNYIFQDILYRNITPSQASAKVMNIISICPLLLQVWQLVLDRQTVPDCIQFTEIVDIVIAFQAKGAGFSDIFNFFLVIIQAVHSQVTNSEILCRLLKYFSNLKFPITAEEVLQHGLTLIPLIPRMEEIDDKELPLPPKQLSEKDIYQIEFPPKNRNIATFRPIVVDENNKDKEATKREKVGPSYEILKIDIDSGCLSLLFNDYCHSYSTGSEGDNYTQYSERETFLQQLRYHMFNTFESLVISDQHLYSCYSFGKIPGILFRGILSDLYGDPVWKEVFLKLRNQPIPDFIQERAQNALLEFTAHKFNTSFRVDLLMNHYPVFDLAPYQIFSELSKSVTIPFCDNNGNITSAVLTKIATSGHMRTISWFLNMILPLFMVTSSDEAISIIGTDALANALFYYGKISKCIDNIFNDSIEKENVPSAVVYRASHFVEKVHMAPSQTTLCEYVAHFANNFTKGTQNYEDMIDSAQYHFGSKTKSFLELMMALTRLSAIASRVEITHIFESIKKLSNIFGRARGNHAAERLKARFPFYKTKAQTVFRVPLIRIDRAINEKEITITPI